MKTFFVEARENEKIVLPINIFKLPEKIVLFTTVQYIRNVDVWKKDLEDAGKKVILIKPVHAKYAGQILGCSIDKFDDNFDAFLYIGDGLFHPKALMLKNDKPVFIYNPKSKEFFELKKEELDEIKKKLKIGLVKFYSSKKIGVLISTKPGQFNLKDALVLKKKFADKEFFFLVDDTFNFDSLEDFNFIECYVNTACPRISYDDSVRLNKPVVDVNELL